MSQSIQWNTFINQCTILNNVKKKKKLMCITNQINNIRSQVKGIKIVKWNKDITS